MAGGEALVDFLSDPASYPEGTTGVERVETHISYVFLTDERAYKLKKPVDFGFVDFRDAATRRQACYDELRLNRRLAPDVYLDVVPITGDGPLKLGGAGPPLDWLVVMRRLPERRRLDLLIQQAAPLDEELVEVSRMLHGFYVSQPPLTLATGEYVRRIERHVRDNWKQLACEALAPRGVQLDRIHGRQLLWLTTRAGQFEQRVRQGRLVDGHGDLRPEHIYLLQPPVAIDCIEFSRELRELDELDELCFLAMECDALGSPQVGRRILAAYRSEQHDEPPPGLVEFYKSYRASVRAKVCLLRSEQVGGSEQAGLLESAGRYLELADEYGRCGAWGRPLLLVVRGPMGSGKSTLARRLAYRLGAQLIETDQVRRELFGEPGRREAYGEGRYSRDNRRRVYERVFERASQLLEQHRSVVLDGTFSDRQTRRAARDVAERQAAVLAAARCDCPPEVARRRIAERQMRADELSEARPELYDRQLSEQAPADQWWPEFGVPTDISPEKVERRAIRQLTAAIG